MINTSLKITVSEKEDTNDKTGRIIEHDGKVIALVFSSHIKADGVNFLTPQDYTLQLGLIEHPAGNKVREHFHNPNVMYKVDTTQEYLYIEKGKVVVSLFAGDWQIVEKVVLSGGDSILFVNGGHGLEVIKDCRIFEIKQGPYPGEAIAKIFREEK